MPCRRLLGVGPYSPEDRQRGAPRPLKAQVSGRATTRSSVQIAARGCNARVTEGLLHQRDWRATVEAVRRVGIAQPVVADLGLQPGQHSKPFKVRVLQSRGTSFMWHNTLVRFQLIGRLFRHEKSQRQLTLVEPAMLSLARQGWHIGKQDDPTFARCAMRRGASGSRRRHQD